MHLRGRDSTCRARRALVLVVAGLLVAGCATAVNGRLVTSEQRPAANVRLDVRGAASSGFDVTAQNALSDIMAFWRSEYPKISGGKPLAPLAGGLYSVDGRQVATTGAAPAYATQNACIAQDAQFIVDNGAFCPSDDSIAWDRNPDHLFAKLAAKYGDLMVALIFAHEFGHAISFRLGDFSRPGVQTIDLESQADCAAGAWAASALKGQDPHFPNVTAQTLDDALEGYLNGRDASAKPGDPQDITHGNGFDRLSALADGIDHGASYCFSPTYFDRTFTERPYTDPSDYAAGGNAPLSEVLAPDASNVFVNDLNRFWTAAATTIGETFRPVAIAEASHPPCDGAGTRFGYCTDTNTVYYDATFARSVYYSLPTVTGDDTTGDVTIQDNQPADFALGVMLSIGWGMAVRHQLFTRTIDGPAALTAAICYSGSYAKDVNVAAGAPGKITLSPSDLDEAVSAMIDKVGLPDSFAARGTSGLDRIQSFVKGYKQGLSSC